jgi:hypothetical protein
MLCLIKNQPLAVSQFVIHLFGRVVSKNVWRILGLKHDVQLDLFKLQVRQVGSQSSFLSKKKERGIKWLKYSFHVWCYLCMHQARYLCS